MFIDNENFRQLYDKHFKEIFGYIRRCGFNHHDAENLTQETFIKILEYTSNIEHPRAFLIKVACNVINEYWRKNKKGKLISVEEHLDDKDAIENLINKLIYPSTLPKRKKSQELHSFLKELVQTLPEKEKMIIKLRYFNDPPLRWKDIRKIFGYSHPTLTKLYKSAITKLRKEIERYLD